MGTQITPMHVSVSACVVGTYVLLRSGSGLEVASARVEFVVEEGALLH